MRNAKVILNQDVYNLGEEGDVREVAPGYARNFLIPQGLAVQYSKQNLAVFEQRREVIQKRKEEKRQTAMGLKEQIETKTIELDMPSGDTGRLFGSVNSATIMEKLAAEGISIERKKIDVPDNNIKMIGEYTVRIRLYGDEIAEVHVIVNPAGGKKVLDAKKEAAEAAAKAKEKAEKAAAEAPVEATTDDDGTQEAVDAEKSEEPSETPETEPEEEKEPE